MEHSGAFYDLELNLKGDNMSRISGRYGRVKMTSGATTGPSITFFANVKDWSLNIDNGVIDATDFDSSGWKASLAGISGWGFDFNANHTNTLPTLLPGTAVNIALRAGKHNTTSYNYYYGAGIIASAKPSFPVAGEATIAYSVTGDGVLSTKVSSTS
jgi:hypothetical protein